MELSKEALDILYQAMEYAKKRNYEYVTPELVLLMMLRDKTFTEAFEECGGNAGMLEDYLKEYAEEYMDKAEVEKAALAAEAVQPVLAGKTVRKVIVVKNIVNIVVG